MKRVHLNLTPHKITIVGENKSITLEPSGYVARVITRETKKYEVPIKQGDVTVIVPAVEREQVDVQLPDPREVLQSLNGISGVVLLVSSMVGDYVKNKGLPPEWLAVARIGISITVAAPDTGPDSVVRDSEGRIIGVRRIVVYKSLPE